jgi:5-methyltetrahydropteroyltriglutamate--homocysteine methyltransferase
MHQSTDRILTTHVGSLPRPQALIAAYKNGVSGKELEVGLEQAAASVVARQIETGLDIVNDGEVGKPMSRADDIGAWSGYIYDRLDGYENKKLTLDEHPQASNRDWHEFPTYYGDQAPAGADGKWTVELPVATGPIAYTGGEQVARDVRNLRSALSGVDGVQGFMAGIAPGETWGYGEYYANVDEEATALAEALREEYRVIADAGFIVQLDNPHLVDKFTFDYAMDWDVDAHRKWAERHVELVNHAIAGIPPEQVRLHACWGSWNGPHASDLPMKDIVDIMLRVNAGSFSFEAANARHEHEWAVWQDVKLPDGKVLVPGVVTHKTEVVEHPELVAQRIVRFAEVVGRENVIASTDCGMGGRLNEEIAWAKLRALTEGAEIASQRLWNGGA